MEREFSDDRKLTKDLFGKFVNSTRKDMLLEADIAQMFGLLTKR
jgi:uncharacterized protein YbcI